MKRRSQNPERMMKHALKRMDIKGKRIDRLETTWLKLRDRQKGLEQVLQSALQELKSPKPNRKKISNVETVVNDLLADAEKTLTQIDKISKTGMKLPIQVAWAPGEWARLEKIQKLATAFKKNYEGFLKTFNEMKRAKGIA